MALSTYAADRAGRTDPKTRTVEHGRSIGLRRSVGRLEEAMDVRPTGLLEDRPKGARRHSLTPGTDMPWMRFNLTVAQPYWIAYHVFLLDGAFRPSGVDLKGQRPAERRHYNQTVAVTVFEDAADSGIRISSADLASLGHAGRS